MKKFGFKVTRSLIFRKTNDERYDGEWKEGKRNGEGQIRWPNGRWRGGLWKNGDHVKWTTTERIGGKRKPTMQKQ